MPILIHPSHRLKHDPVTGQYSDNDGVEIRVPGFGRTSSIEYLDPSLKFFANYFHDMIQWFVDKGYTRGKDIVGAPYDWRYSPSKFSYTCEMMYFVVPHWSTCKAKVWIFVSMENVV